MNWTSAAAVFALAGALAASPLHPPRGKIDCRVDGELTRNPDIPEASGLAAGRRNPGVLWAVNDSAGPVLIELDARGRTIGRVRVQGAAVEDWEDVAAGPCGLQSCLYVGDIGDNDARREHISVYRVTEPSTGDTTTNAAVELKGAYPDGPHDAEAMFVTKDGGVFILTKGSSGPAALYRFPSPLERGPVMRLERVGEPYKGGNVARGDRPTGAAVSTDGGTVAIRTNDYVLFFKAADLAAGRWKEQSKVEVTDLGEPRGEGIAFGPNGKLFLVGEGHDEAGAGTFASLTCTSMQSGPDPQRPIGVSPQRPIGVRP